MATNQVKKPPDKIRRPHYILAGLFLIHVIVIPYLSEKIANLRTQAAQFR